MATDQSPPAPTGTGPDKVSRSTDRVPASERDDVSIRPFDAGDRDGIVGLYEAVGRQSVDEWFRWKYEENPYADGVAPIVADRDGEILGVAPCFSLAFGAGSTQVAVGQPADLEIHPDFDGGTAGRRDLESRLLARLESRCRERDLDIVTTVASGDEVATRRELGWEPIGPVPTCYRIQEPKALLPSGTSGRASEISRAARPLTAACHRARERFVSTPSDVTVYRFDDVPVDQFAALAAASDPDGIHAIRDESFYGWRFNNPLWSIAAYVASRGGEPIAGVITGTKTERDGTVLTCLFDVTPLSPTAVRADGVRAILDRLVDDRRGSDLLAASGNAMPSTLLKQFGFVADDSPPLSWFGSSTIQLAAPPGADGHPWTVANRAIADPSNWSITFADRAW